MRLVYFICVLCTALRLAEYAEHYGKSLYLYMESPIRVSRFKITDGGAGDTAPHTAPHTRKSDLINICNMQKKSPAELNPKLGGIEVIAGG